MNSSAESKAGLVLCIVYTIGVTYMISIVGLIASAVTIVILIVLVIAVIGDLRTQKSPE